MLLKIRVMTFNMHHGRGIDGKLSLERIASIIEASKADVIGLNEVDRSFSRRSKYVDQLSWLANHLQMDYAFGPAIALKANKKITKREYGNGLLSRYPILRQENHPFAPIPQVKEGRAMLEVDISFAQEVLKVYVTHLSLQLPMRKKEIDIIIERVKAAKGAVLLLGDFNMKPGSAEWASITNHLVDVVQLTAQKTLPTYPSLRPSLQLDYIFCNAFFHVKKVESIRLLPWASDHLPLQATLWSVQQNEG